MRLVGRFTEARALLDLFVVRIVDTSALSLDPEEVTDAEWVTLDEVARRRKAGIMAAPWEPRLVALWSHLVELVDC
jgi:8-oxo-dGTP diphosphatase